MIVAARAAVSKAMAGGKSLADVIAAPSDGAVGRKVRQGLHQAGAVP